MRPAGKMVDLVELDGQVAFYKGQALSVNTRKTYSAQWKSYIAFFDLLGTQPLPASPLLLCRYAAYLARRLKYSSIKRRQEIASIPP